MIESTKAERLTYTAFLWSFVAGLGGLGYRVVFLPPEVSFSPNLGTRFLFTRHTFLPTALNFTFVRLPTYLLVPLYSIICRMPP